jgi:CheY-like chemotaxis protein
LAVVNDILDFSKLESGRFEIRPHPAQPGRLALEAASLFEVQAASKGVALIVDIGKGLPDWIMTDADRLRQILMNLLGNALKFTPEGRVVLRVRSAPGAKLRFEVEDTGSGISPEGLSRLFQRFSQVDQTPARVVGGTGLGLAICKGLVSCLGGEIGVSSRLGQGSCFWFEIPAERCVPESADSPDLSGQAPLAGSRVLVVDDNPANRELVSIILRRFDLQVAVAEDGRQAVEMALKAPFDLILMDIRMPGMDGPAALAALRGQPGPNIDVPVIAFTAEVSPDAMGMLRREGFDDHIAKPINPGELVATVSRWTRPAPPRGALARV